MIIDLQYLNHQMKAMSYKYLLLSVETLKKETVPKSAKHSIATRDKPAIIAGLADGNIILKKLSLALYPKFLLTSIKL